MDNPCAPGLYDLALGCAIELGSNTYPAYGLGILEIHDQIVRAACLEKQRWEEEHQPVRGNPAAPMFESRPDNKPQLRDDGPRIVCVGTARPPSRYGNQPLLLFVPNPEGVVCFSIATSLPPDTLVGVHASNAALSSQQ